MNQNDAIGTLNRLTDGQSIRVTVASGRTFEGIYDGEQSSLEEGLYFETLDGKSLRADWDKIQDVSFRSARMTVDSRFVVPPEHPLSGAGPTPVRNDGVPLRPHTSRNR